MSANQSSLSSPQYGYDFVVATTQSSINSTLKEYLASLGEPEVTVCYVADNQGHPTPIDYATLKQNAKGSDPFAVPANANPATNMDLQNLFGARFILGFKAQIGLPPGYAPVAMPDLVVLGGDTSAVTYNMTCSEFIAVQYTPASGYSPAQWFSQSQQPGNAWIFSSKVDLRLTSAGSNYSQLPPAVKAQIKNMGANAFSVQQLLFDLDNAALESFPTFSGVPANSPLISLMKDNFIDLYYAQMKAKGQPVLGCVVTQSTAPASSLVLSDFTFETLPLLGTNGQPIAQPTQAQRDLSTLSYLCATNHDVLPPPVKFSWNWMEPSDVANFDGVIAINRNTLANYFRSELNGYVSQNCYSPHVTVTEKDLLDATYKWSMTPDQKPTVTAPTTGSTVLTYTYTAKSNDQAGSNGCIGQMQLQSTFGLNVAFSGDTIVVTQHLVIYSYIKHLATGDGGNIVDKTITDTYTVAVDENGSLKATLSSSAQDHSQSPKVNGFLNFWTGVNDLESDVENWTRHFIGNRLTDIPLNFVQQFVFPGGNTFVFKDAGFSQAQDLVAHISYADPS